MNGEILLIRHSLTEANERGLYCGKTDLPLSLQGKILAMGIAQEGKYIAPPSSKFFTSGMKRADETLKLLFGSVEFKVLHELKEMDFGEFEMLSFEELKDKKDYRLWIAGDNVKNKCPGGESAEEMTKRAVNAACDIFHNQSTVIVTHGGVIAAIMAYFFEKEKKNRYQWQPKPCGGFRLITENGVPIRYYNI